MKFTRHERPQRFQWTNRKLSAAQSKARRQAEKVKVRYPLLAEVLPLPTALDIDDESVRRQNAIDEFTFTLRAFHARVWRESRRDYFAGTIEQRASIRNAWTSWRGPTTSLYFRYIVDVHTGVMAARGKTFKDRERFSRSVITKLRAAQGKLAI